VAEDIRLDMAAVDAPAALRPTRVVTASGPATIAGRPLTVNLARHAATEGDVWIHDPATGTVIVGDLVTGAAPFLDTACPEGWRRALAEIAATPFERLIPGHGEPMSRSEFRTWRSAFAALVDCAEAGRQRRDCVAGWMWNAAPFIGEDEGPRVERLVAYYLETRLEPPAKRREHCPPA
jgi:glyoxylase-like metal-dependent hydrolase (beta-lactamase superfamily II)